MVVPLASTVRGDIVVSVTPSGAGTGTGNHPSGSNINLSTTYASATPVQYLILITNSNDTTGHITVDANSASYVEISFGNPLVPSSTVGSIASVTRSSTSTASAVIRHINSTGSVGPISMTAISGGYAGGGFGLVEAKPASDGLVAPNIGALSANGFTGDVLAESGSIAQIYSSAATIGTSLSPISIRAAGNIGYILGTSVYAHISGPTGNPDSVTIGRIDVSTGPLFGSIRMDSFGSNPTFTGRRIVVAGGDIDADISIGSFDFTSGSASVRPTIELLGSGKVLKPNRTIRIGGSLEGQLTEETPIAFDFVSGGLQGQIIINADDVGGDWTAPIKIGSVKLDNARSAPNRAPDYDYTHTALGGGAIGLVPFALNNVDCTPTNDEVACTLELRNWDESEEFDRETLILRFYGPVLDASASGIVPIEIEALDLACPPPPTVCPNTYNSITSNCEVRVAPPGFPREVWISLTPTTSPSAPVPFNQAYKYKVTPTLDAVSGETNLRSDSGISPAPEITPFTYEVTIMCSPPSP